MGDTRTPRSPDPLLRATLAALPPTSVASVPASAERPSLHAGPCRWAVACSGGRDSVALLHVAAQRAWQLSQAGRRAEVVALHVHHGLSPHADLWASHVQTLCRAWADQGWPVRARVQHVKVVGAPGDSLEAEARRLRHAALHDMALDEGLTEIWLAHHQRDQAETFLLQALRGGGVKGLAAMPAAQQRQSVLWVRPWLDVPVTDVAAHVQRHGLVHIEDESNADTRWARNRLRHAVWPGLQTQFASVDASLADAARHVGDALPVLASWLSDQLQRDGMTGPDWAIGPWARRPANERRLLLSAWYQHVSGRRLTGHWVTRLAQEWPVLHATHSPWFEEALGLRLYRGQVTWRPDAERRPPSTPPQAPSQPPPVVLDLQVTSPGVYALAGWSGRLLVRQVDAVGAGRAEGEPLVGALRLTDAGHWQLKPRTGGERWQAHAAGPARNLKKQFQAAALPPWARQGPLIWQGERLLWVPGLGVDARHRAAPGEPHWLLAFLPDGGPAGVGEGL